MVYHYGLCIIFVAATAVVPTHSHLSPEISSGKAMKDDSSVRSYDVGLWAQDTAARKAISNTITDSLVNAPIRRRRGMSAAARLSKKGIDAVKYLVHGARELKPRQFPMNPSSNLVRHFQKLGDYKKALEDFYGTKPERVKDFTTPTGLYGKAAFVGDRILYVKSSNEFTGTPTLEVLKIDTKSKKVKLTDLISYAEN